MRQERQETLLRGLLLLLLLLGCRSVGASQGSETPRIGLFGDICTSDQDCVFENSVCQLSSDGKGKCSCHPELPLTNYINKCGKASSLNEICFIDEQCKATTSGAECINGFCICRYGEHSAIKAGDSVTCIANQNIHSRKERDLTMTDKKTKLFGDPCSADTDCEFEGSVCEIHDGKGRCQCHPELHVSNHVDKCGKAARVNESCFFNEQCEALTPETECRDGICSCRFEKQPSIRSDGKTECIVIQNNYLEETRYVDPAMIGILVAMFLMFITICVVLRLFSRARWRENRTIFNTPNPRLMNVSLLRDSKLLHQERRGSRSSARGPSRQPSMASLRAHSPNSQEGSRRGSRGSSNASATSNRSNKSPPQAHNLSSATTPMLESVTVEVQEPKV